MPIDENNRHADKKEDSIAKNDDRQVDNKEEAKQRRD
jgi:hypothetical protein